MNIQLMTMWYNEEDFAPYFLKHYSWVDKIHLILDSDTNDSTLSIIEKFDNVVIEEFKFPDMMDDSIKINKFNSKYRELDSDWTILVDSDEFIFDKNLNPNIKSYLETKSDKLIIFSHLWNVYRHTSETDLDINKPVMEQRRHGMLNLHNHETVPYTKPNVVKTGQPNLYWTTGHHNLMYNGSNICYGDNNPQYVESIDILNGVHWSMVDVDIAIKRRIYGRKLRQSQHNIQCRMTVQNHFITEDQIRHECEFYKNHPPVF